jgi:hypothetical protein
MTEANAYIWVVIGVIVAVIFPVLRGFIRGAFPPTAAVGVPPWVKKYGALLIFSLIAALICLAIWKQGNPTLTLEWYTAFLLGFGWESAIEKFTG